MFVILEQYRRIYKVRLINAREIREGRKKSKVHFQEKEKQLRNTSKLNNIIYKFTYKL